MTERWLPVVGYEGLYEVSDQGRVRSLSRLVGTRWNTPRRMPERILRPATTYLGYRMVSLRREGRSRSLTVHRLVLIAFGGPPPTPKHQCCHGDGDPANNRIENLRWGTASDNQQDRLRHGTHHFASKTHCLRGHEFTPENTYEYRGPGVKTQRTCKQCTAMRYRRYRLARMKAKEAA